MNGFEIAYVWCSFREEDVKDTFWRQLERRTLEEADIGKKSCDGNMNGWVKGVMGRYGVPDEKGINERKYGIWASAGMSVRNTWFQQRCP